MKAATAVLAAALAAPPGPQPSPPPAPETRVSLHGSLTHWALANTRPRFSEPSRHWMETSARLSAAFARGDLTANVGLIAVRTTGEDPFGTGTPAPGAPAGTPVPSAAAEVDLDEAWIRLDRAFGAPLRLTAGRQPIALGTQFLVGDGVYDGFAPATAQGVWHNPRRSFDGLRAEWTPSAARTDASAERSGVHPRLAIDAFLVWVDPTWDGGGGRDGLLAGVEVSRRGARGEAAATVLRRTSRSGLDNDMWVLGARGEGRLPSGLWAGGEVAWQTGGTCGSAAYCTAPGQAIDESAWHAEAGWRSEAGAKPFVEVGYVAYSDDFTPIATGFADWGRWYLGNQVDWIVFSSDTRVVRAEAGLWPSAAAKLRLQYHHTRLASRAGTVSHEWTLVGEWYPHDAFWANAAVGWSEPGPALAGLANPFAVLRSGASRVGGRPSLDLVVGLGVRF